MKIMLFAEIEAFARNDGLDPSLTVNTFLVDPILFRLIIEK